ncbi:MAG TPA: 2OG-Fe(II) oxygenase [Burkholderiales bacterium]|nr:2OG-Fe(II) oxygenase [Burkholderiales bacterium]
MAQRELTQEWKDWVAHNVQRGASVDEMFEVLVREGFEPDTAARELNIRRVALKRFPSDKLELYTAEDFMLPHECDELVDIIKANLRPSEISHDGSADSSFRTSRTCDLIRGEEAVRILDQRICGAMGIDPKLAEPSQGQYYDVAQEFKPHTDYFERYELAKHSTPTLGQRTWTFMIYLNDVEEGGHTNFVNVGLSIPPKRGTAVIWNNLKADGSGNYDTLHHGTPVKRGYKAIITKWFRRPR